MFVHKPVKEFLVQCFKYLQNGFTKIHSELDTIEVKMKQLTGLVFTKHLYSRDELFYALDRVESFVENMSGYLDEMEAVKSVNHQVRLLFSKKAEETYHRLESLHCLIEQREPTWWEKARVILKRIIAKLLQLFPLEMIAGKFMETLAAAA